MKRHGKFVAVLLSGAACTIPGAAIAQTPAPAASAPDATDTAQADSGDIVVTAQKRSENVQDVPISIRAFNGSSLAQEGINTPVDLQRLVPAFRVATPIGTVATRVAIRGIGTLGASAVEPSVATFVNGIYVPRPASIINSFLDIEAVEVLNGPQGTLFGRNASVGAFSYRTGTPTGTFSGSLRTEYSTGEHSRTEGVINVPLSDTISVRAAGLVDLLGGYWFHDGTDERFGKLNTYQGRLSLKADLTPSLVWNLRGDYQKTKGDGTVNAKLIPSTLTPTTLARFQAEMGGAPLNLDQYSRHNSLSTDNNHVNDTYWSVSSDLAYTTDGDFTLRLLDGYNDWNAPQSDGDTAQFPIYVVGRNLHYKSQSHSHELQLISPKDKLLDGKLDFVAGLYYYHEDYGIRIENLRGPNFCSTFAPLPAFAGLFSLIPGATTADKIINCNGLSQTNSFGDFDQTTRSLASYGQATFKILPTLDLTGGIRYTDEKKSGSYVGNFLNITGRLFSTTENTSLRLKSSKVTWRANLSWHPADDVMLFATVSTGFKSGGFNNALSTVVIGQQRIFQPETATNYEIGIKSQFLNRAVTFNATAFRLDIDNYQERGQIGLTSTTRNVGSVRQQGIEFDGVVKPVDHVRLNAAVTYIDSNIRSYCGAPMVVYLTGAAPASCPGFPANTRDASGERLTLNPKWQGVVGATIDGAVGHSGWRWTLLGDINFTSTQNLSPNIDNGPLTVQKGYALLNARLTFTGPDDKWTLGIFGRNLADKGYCAFKGSQTLGPQLGLNYDLNGDGVNDGTATRCFLGTPRVIGATAGIKF